MFYDAVKNDHGLRYDPFKAIVAPRPIGWITSMRAKGEINLARCGYDEYAVVTEVFSIERPTS